MKGLEDSKMLTVEGIKALGASKNRSEENLDYLIDLFVQDAEKNEIPVEIKREIVSSIGRQSNKEKIKEFLKKWAFQKNEDTSNISMDVVYQMFRTALYLYRDAEDEDLVARDLVRDMQYFYFNEVMNKMCAYSSRKWQGENQPVHRKSHIQQPMVLEGDACVTLKQVPDLSVQLIFTSPPYYNARMYSSYINYRAYLDAMWDVFQRCYDKLEDGRFIIVNVSPVITKRPGREFESTRYPIHYDLHQVLVRSGFYFVDEIYWIKPEPSVPNRVGGYLQTRKPLGYKPNCITESLMVYRKNCDFLLDTIMKQYPEYDRHEDEEVDTSNCWYITPKSDKDHPAVFPEELCHRVLKYYSFEGDVVLDPFAGSGTLGRVAQQMGRIPILCEQNPEYVHIIKQRMGMNTDEHN